MALLACLQCLLIVTPPHVMFGHLDVNVTGPVMVIANSRPELF